jgi:hypothetical protein
MRRRQRRFLVAASIASLLALTAAAGADTATASAGAVAVSSSLPASAVAFAERAIARDQPTDRRRAGSWRNALELMALVGTCAIAAAFYSAATARRTDTLVRVRRR